MTHFYTGIAMDFDDIQDDDFLEIALSPALHEAIDKSPYDLELLFEDSIEVSDSDALIEETFPASEYQQYQVTTAFCSYANPLVLACIKDGIVYGVASLSIEDNEAELLCLAVDQNCRGKKIGSLLMLAINDIALTLGITTISLISSPNGTMFYQSFGFSPMAMQSFEASFPLKQAILETKLLAFNQIHNQAKPLKVLGKKRSINEPDNAIQTKKKCTQKISDLPADTALANISNFGATAPSREKFFHPQRKGSVFKIHTTRNIGLTSPSN